MVSLLGRPTLFYTYVIGCLFGLSSAFEKTPYTAPQTQFIGSAA
jgi:hypothetical protein